MDNYLVSNIIEETRVSWVSKALRRLWCYFQLQILKWDLEGLDPRYVIPEILYSN